MYKLAFYVPIDDAESVKKAVFEAGAGHIGLYENVCFQTRGTGQFRPTEGANPHIGAVGSLASVEEFKIEMICDEAHIHGAIAALKLAHPYEEVSYDVWLLADL
ncbi:NGG1p interacting factor NIF3 [Halomonas sp. MC140]|nr:NGG1p interacting factor NIF3 [Halomonas sp. MC140]MDN7131726.1 NGG1p interacting factor NIF3 [Halomonas sp. MC140]